MPTIRIELPWPPSVNRYWQDSAQGGRHLTRRAREYRAEVAARIMLNSADLHTREAVALDLLLRPADYRVRDSDNILKGLLDALEFAGVFEDDRQVRELRLRWGCPVRPAVVIAEVTTLGYALDEWRDRCRGESV